MIHSPFGTNKKQQRGNLNRTRDEESLLLQGRNYSDFGKQLQADEMSFSKSIHQGSIKRYQVKTDFKKHVENTNQKRIKQMKKSQITPNFRRQFNETTHTLPLNDRIPNQMLFGFGQSQVNQFPATNSDSTWKNQNMRFLNQPDPNLTRQNLSKKLDLGFENPGNSRLENMKQHSGFFDQDRFLNSRIHQRNFLPNTNFRNNQFENQNSGMFENPRVDFNIQNSIPLVSRKQIAMQKNIDVNGQNLNNLDNQNIEKRVQFTEPLQTEGKEKDFQIRPQNEQSWIAPDYNLMKNKSSFSAANKQLEPENSFVQNVNPDQSRVRTSILKSSLFPQNPNQRLFYPRVDNQFMQPQIPNRSEAHQFLSSFLPPHYKMQSEIPLKMPPRMTQIIELARKEGRARKRRDIAQLGLMIYLIQNKILIWEYRTGRFGEKDFQEIIRDIRVLKLAGKEIFMMLEYQNEKMDILRIRPEETDFVSENSINDNSKNQNAHFSQARTEESDVVKIEITEKPIIPPNPDQNSHEVKIEMDQNTDKKTLRSSNAPIHPLTLKIEKVKRNLKNLQIVFSEWVPEMNGLFFIDSFKRVSTAVWDEELNQLRIRQQYGGSSSEGPGPAPKFKNLKRIKKTVVALFSSRRHYSYRLKIIDGLLYLLKTTFTLDKNKEKSEANSEDLHDMFDNPLYLMDLPSFATAFYSKHTKRLNPGQGTNQSIINPSNASSYSTIKIVSQKILNYAIRPDGQLIPRGKLNLNKVFKINTATLNCHFAASGGYDFSKRIVDFRIEPESRDQLLKRALARCDSKEKLNLGEAVGHLRDVVDEVTNSLAFEEARLVSRHIVLLMENGVEVQIEPFEGLVTKLDILSLQQDSELGKTVLLGYLCEGEVVFSRGEKVFMLTKNSLQLLNPQIPFTIGKTANHHPLPCSKNSRTRQIQDLRALSYSSIIYDLRHNYSSPSNKFSFTKTRLLTTEQNPVQVKSQKFLFPRLSSPSNIIISETKGGMRPIKLLKSTDFLSSILWLMGLEIEANGEIGPYLGMLAALVEVWGLNEIVKSLLFLFSIEEVSKSQVEVQYDWILTLGRVFNSRVPQIRVLKGTGNSEIMNEPDALQKQNEAGQNNSPPTVFEQNQDFDQEWIVFEDLPSKSRHELELTDSRFYRLKRLVLCMLKVFGGLGKDESTAVIRTLLQSRITAEAVKNYEIQDEPEVNIDILNKKLNPYNLQNQVNPIHPNNKLKHHQNNNSLNQSKINSHYGALEMALLEIFSFDLERICKKPLLTSEFSPQRSMIPLLNRDSQKIKPSMFKSLASFLGLYKDKRSRSVIIDKKLASPETLNDIDIGIYMNWHGGIYGNGIADNLGYNNNYNFWDPHLPTKQNMILGDFIGDRRNNASIDPNTKNNHKSILNDGSSHKNSESDMLELKLLRFIRSKFGDDLYSDRRETIQAHPRNHRIRLNVGLLELKKLLEKSMFLDQLISKLKSEWVKIPFSGLGSEIIRNINKYGSPYLSDLIYGFLENFPAEKNLTGLERVTIVSTLLLNLLIIDNISPKYLERGISRASAIFRSHESGLKKSFLSSEMDSFWRNICVEVSGKFFFNKSGILKFFFKEPVANLLVDIEELKISLKEEAREIEYQRKTKQASKGVQKQKSKIQKNEEMNISSDEDEANFIKEKKIDYSNIKTRYKTNRNLKSKQQTREMRLPETKNQNYLEQHRYRQSLQKSSSHELLSVDKSASSQKLKSVYLKIRGLICEFEVAHLFSIMPIFTCRGYKEDALMFIELMCAKFSDLSEEKRLTEFTAKKEIERLEDQIKKLSKGDLNNQTRTSKIITLRKNENSNEIQKSGVPRLSTASESPQNQLPLDARLQTVRATLELKLQDILSQQKSIKLFFVSFLITSERFRTFNENLQKKKSFKPSFWEKMIHKTKNLIKKIILGYGKEDRHFRYSRESFEGFLGWLAPKELIRLYKSSLQVLLAQKDEELRLFALETALTLDQSRRLVDVEESLKEDDLVQLLNKNPRMKGKVGVQNMLFLIHFFSKKKRYGMAVDLVLKVCRGDYLPERKREAARGDPVKLLELLANILLQTQRFGGSSDQEAKIDGNNQQSENNNPEQSNSQGQNLFETELLSIEESLNIDSYITLEKKLALLSRTSLLLGSLGQPEERISFSRQLKEQTSLLKLQQSLQTEIKDVLRKLDNISQLPECYSAKKNILKPTSRVFKCLSAQLEHGLLMLPVLVERVIRPFKLFNGLDSYLKNFIVPEDFFQQNYFANLLQAAKHYSMSGSIESCFRLKNFIQFRGCVIIDNSNNGWPTAVIINGDAKNSMIKTENINIQGENYKIQSDATLLMIESTNLATYNPNCTQIIKSQKNSIKSGDPSQQSEILRIEAIAALARSNLIFPYNIYPPLLNSLTHFVYLNPTEFKELRNQSTNPGAPNLSNQNQQKHEKNLFKHTNLTTQPSNGHSRRENAIIQDMLAQQKMHLLSVIESASAMNSFVDLLMRRRTCERLYNIGIKEVESLWFSDHLIKNEPQVGDSYLIFDLYFRLWMNAHSELTQSTPDKNHMTTQNQDKTFQNIFKTHNSHRSDRAPNRYQRKSQKNRDQQVHNSTQNQNRLTPNRRNQSPMINLSSDQLAARYHSTTRLFITCLQLIQNLMVSQDTHFERFILTPDTHMNQKQELASYLLKFETRISQLEKLFLGMDSRETQNCLLSFGNDSFLLLGDSLKRKLFQYLKSVKRGKLKAFEAKRRLLN